MKGLFYRKQVEVLTTTDHDGIAWQAKCLGIRKEAGTGIPLEYYHMVSENGDHHFLAKDVVLRITLRKKPKKSELKLASKKP